ncbi:MAG: hypothetical protein ACI30I_04230 [Parabacteroides sp.]
MNYQGNINLLRFDKSGLMMVSGRTGQKLCVVIPVEENDIYVSRDENLKPRGAYVAVSAWQNRVQNGGVDQYGNTHGIKQSFSQEYREAHTEEEMRAKPFLGNLKPMETRQAPVTAPQVEAAPYGESYEELPF